MLQHRLFDVEMVLNRTIVYLVLTLFVAAAYAAAVFGVPLAAPGSTLGAFTAGLLDAARIRGDVELADLARLYAGG